jgi:hypothetical protein
MGPAVINLLRCHGIRKEGKTPLPLFPSLMNTRGYKVYRYKGRYFVYYNHCDSYPDCLGVDILRQTPRNVSKEQFERWGQGDSRKSGRTMRVLVLREDEGLSFEMTKRQTSSQSTQSLSNGSTRSTLIISFSTSTLDPCFVWTICHGNQAKSS